jgi:hypothetical protein
MLRRMAEWNLMAFELELANVNTCGSHQNQVAYSYEGISRLRKRSGGEMLQSKGGPPGSFIDTR